MGYSYLIPRRLAQGSAPTYSLRDFDVVVLCARELQLAASQLGGQVEVIGVPLDDSGQPPADWEIAAAFATAARVARRVRAGKRVLVTCREGRNRSGLVNGFALQMLGDSAEAAIARIVRARPTALTNTWFTAALLQTRRVA